MPVSDSFVAFVREQLEPIGALTPKRMFGGVGLYAGELFFGIVMRDVLYLKADDSTRGAREAAGGLPFQPFPDRPRSNGVTQYYSVPVSTLEDRDELIAWAKQAIAIARAHTQG
jgi:DNA transformation protein and related proteins